MPKVGSECLKMLRHVYGCLAKHKDALTPVSERRDLEVFDYLPAMFLKVVYIDPPSDPFQVKKKRILRFLYLH